MPHRGPAVSAERLPGAEGAVLLDAEGTVARGLNETGARMWELMDGVRNVADISRALAAEFEVDAATAQREVLALLEQLATRGLISPR